MSEQVITFSNDDQRQSNPRAAMVRAETRSARGYANQRAHDLRIGPQPAYVDDSRSHLNRILIEPPTAPEMRRMVEERREQRETSRALKSNAGIAVIGIIGLGVEAARLFSRLTQEQQDAAFLKAGQRIARAANTTLVGAVSHLDESSLHAHLSFCGYDLDGLPLSSTMKRGMLTQFQDILAEVMAEHCPGIERGNSRWNRIKAGADYAETVHKTVAEIHNTLLPDRDRLLQENRDLKQIIQELALRIAAQTGRLEEMQARVAKLSNEEKQRELTTAKVKRLRTYRARLADQVGDLRATRDELNRLAAHIEENQKLVTELESRADQAEQRAARATGKAQEAEQAAETAEGRQSKAEAALGPLEIRKATLTATIEDLENEQAATEASVTALTAEKGILDAEVTELTNTKAKLEPAIVDLENRHSDILAVIVQREAEAAEVRKQLIHAEEMTEAATRRRQEAELAAKAAELSQMEIEASMAALEYAEFALQDEIDVLQQRYVQSESDAYLSEGRLHALRGEIAKSQVEVTDAEERLVKARQAADVAFAEEKATRAALDALRVRQAALEKDVQGLVATKDRLQPELAALEAEKVARASDIATQTELVKTLRQQAMQAKADVSTTQSQKTALEASVMNLTTQKNSIQDEGKKLVRDKTRLETKISDLQETAVVLEQRNIAMEIEFADIRDSLEILRPALQAADALQAMSELDLDEQHDAWAMMITRLDRQCSVLEYASAIRMVDPLFAPDIPLPRSTTVNENLETLHEAAEDSKDIYDAVIETVKAEEGASSGAQAIWSQSLYLSNKGDVAGPGADPDEPGTLGKAFRWAKAAFEGVKRGVGLAIAATRDGIAEELITARANLFNAFEPKVQSALRRLLKAEGEGQAENREPEQRRSVLHDFEP